MKIDILTLFPNMFIGPFNESIIQRAQEKSLVEINLHNLRDWATDKHKTVDDRPYGGGPGMLLKVDVIDSSLTELKTKDKRQKTKVVLLDAGGQKFTQNKAYEYSRLDQLIIICGHYEGVDHRVHEYLVDEVISIGDYVLTGGELPAMVICDTITRLIPGVIKDESLLEESHSPTISHESLTFNKEYPQYTRPEGYKNWKVPGILLSGDHREISKWKNTNS